MKNYKLQQMLELAEKKFREKQYHDAEEILNRVLNLHSINSKANELLSYIHGNRGNHYLAITLLEKATREVDCSAEAHYYYGKMLLSRSLHRDAIESFKKAIEKAGNFFEALHEIGTAYAFLEDHQNALAYYQKCQILKKDSPQLNYNLAKIYEQLKQYTEANKYYDIAINLDPRYLDALINKGNLLAELDRPEDAIKYFNIALKIKSDCQIFYNKANTLLSLNKYAEAIDCFKRAISIKTHYQEAWTNMGLALQQCNKNDEAMNCYEQAIKINDKKVEPLINRGYLYIKLRNFEKAIVDFQKILEIDKSVNWIYGDLIHTELKLCMWSNLKSKKNYIENQINFEQKIINAFSFLAISNNLKIIKKNTEIFAKKNQSKDLFIPFFRKERKKIRIGYYSADLRNHAVSYLMAGLFEQHNRDQFELIAFSFGPITNDGMRQRLEKAFDQFIEVGNMSDMEVAKLSRELDIAIAVDLMGFSGESKTGIFAYRAAPIQVNYLGYPGTMGASYIDYIVADPILIPPEFQDFYTEKVAYLPYSYQVNDRKREISDRKFSRAEVGLPEKGFIFCCFNNNYKILPEIFDIWMRLLQTVDHSVLWLLEDNPAAAKNLKSEAMQRGVDPGRLVFAQRLPSAEHLARHALADLFIDTFPYNAHTTGSDALWAGLPLVTLQGESFASRVASSLLSAIGLPELITHTHQEYEALAIELAMSPQKLASIKQKLIKNRMTTPLFDTNQYTKHLENAYLQMHERYQADLLPENIYIKDIKKFN